MKVLPKVILINLPYLSEGYRIRSFLAFPYGLLSVATWNKDIADITIVDCDATQNYEERIDYLLKTEKPDIVGFSMMFDNSYQFLGPLLKKVKSADPHCMTILGGAAASYSYEEILAEQPDLNAICYSEGEMALQNLIHYMHNWEIVDPSWITRKSIASGFKPSVSYIRELDTAIDIDYLFVDLCAYDMREAFSPFAKTEKRKQFFIVTSRGCPFNCAFCSNGKIHGKEMRFATVNKIIEHVDHLVNAYGMDVLTIYDDQLLLNMNRAKDLFRGLARFNLRIEMPNGLSPAFIDAEMAHLMAKAGVDTAYLAIEHGSERVLRDIIRKPLKLRMVKPAIEWLRGEGIFCHGFFVIGMPGEKEEDRDMTVKFIKDVELDWAGLNPAQPLRGSPLYDQCVKNGWIKKRSLKDSFESKYIINAPEIGVTPEIITAAIDKMNLEVNFHDNYRMRIGDYETAAMCFLEVIRRSPDHKAAKHYLKICREKINGSRP